MKEHTFLHLLMPKHWTGTFFPGKSDFVDFTTHLLKWDSLQMRRQANRLTLLNKSINGQVAIPAQMFLTPVVRPIRRNNSQAFIRPQASKDIYKNSFFPKTINEWNILPEAIVKSPTSEIFKEQDTNHLRSSREIISPAWLKHLTCAPRGNVVK